MDLSDFSFIGLSLKKKYTSLFILSYPVVNSSYPSHPLSGPCIPNPLKIMKNISSSHILKAISTHSELTGKLTNNFLGEVQVTPQATVSNYLKVVLFEEKYSMNREFSP